MGEYRGIMNLCRVLPQGTAAKLAVDKAIDRLSTVGSIREDIQRRVLPLSCRLAWHNVEHCVTVHELDSSVCLHQFLQLEVYCILSFSRLCEECSEYGLSL